MDYKKEISFVGIMSFVSLLVISGFGIKELFIKDTCDRYHGGDIGRCLDVMLFGDYQSTSVIALSLLIVIASFFFLKEGVYKTWRTFALIYLPLAVLWIVASDPLGGNNYVGILDDRESVTFFTAGLFLIASLILIIYKSIRLRGK